MEKNMTTGSPWKHILLFSLPILGGMILQLLYTTVDSIIVGNYVGQEALGAMNTSVSYANLILAIATGMSTGCGIVISQYYGANLREEMRRCISTMLILMLGLGLFLMLFGLFTADLVLRNILGVPDDALPFASTYMRIYFFGMIFQFAYNAFAAELRSVGDSGATMKFLLISSIANVLFDLAFVIGLKLGVAGAALGTVLAQGISAAVSLIYIRKKQPALWIAPKELQFDRTMVRLILKMGVPVTIQTIISNLGVIAIQRLINSFGSTTMAAVAAGSKIESYAVMPNIAFASGMATYAGQNAGAGDLRRVRKGLYSGLAISLVICGSISVIIFLLAQPLVGLFGCSGDAMTFGEEYLRFMACVLVLMGILFIIRGMLQGVGDVAITTVITFVTLAIRIVLAYWMAGLPSIGRKAIYICMGIDFAIGSAFYIIRLIQGKWKQKVLIHKEPQQDSV